MQEMIKKIQSFGIVPVIALEDAADAKPLGKALCDGGLPCAEVTFRTDAAEESIRIMTKEFPEMLVGAGTVLNTDQVDRAMDAGAKFIVSPGFNPKTVKYCVDRNIPIFPGATNPSAIEQALEFGLEVMKFFPAEASGGLKMMKALAGPFTGIKFMPTGGINADNLTDYLDFSKIIACGGSWMVSPELLKAKDFDQIAAITKEAVETMLGFEMMHVGINGKDEAQANELAEAFGAMFGFVKKDGNSAVFAGTGIEIRKSPYLGENGHIAIGTNYMDRAIAHLERQGCEFDYDTAVYKNDKITAIYLKDHQGGFAIHLVQK